MGVEILNTGNAPAAIGPYSQATIAGGFLFSAGQVPLNPGTGDFVEGDIQVQTRQVLANLQAVLSEAGLDWSDVVKTTVFLMDMADFPRFNEVYAEVLRDARPARSTVQVAALPRGSAVEVELVAKVR